MGTSQVLPHPTALAGQLIGLTTTPPITASVVSPANVTVEVTGGPAAAQGSLTSIVPSGSLQIGVVAPVPGLSSCVGA